MVLKYQPLDPAHSEIRLLTLLPDTWDGNVRGSLHIASLDDSPKFEALSYVWGDLNITRRITVDHEPTQVTVNLEACLRRLRHVDEPRMLWVDALCINQRDVLEKNTQLSLMHRVYASASSVVVWLRENDNKNIEWALSWAETFIGKQSQMPLSRYWLDLSATAQNCSDFKRERNIALSNAYHGLDALFSLPYWRRMWTYQELRLSAHDPICVYGIKVLAASTILGDWNPLLIAISNILDEHSFLQQEVIRFGREVITTQAEVNAYLGKLIESPEERGDIGVNLREAQELLQSSSEKLSVARANLEDSGSATPRYLKSLT